MMEINMGLRFSQLKNLSHRPWFLSMEIRGEPRAQQVLPPSQAVSGCLCFVSTEQHLKMVLKSGASLIFALEGVFSPEKSSDKLSWEFFQQGTAQHSHPKRDSLAPLALVQVSSIPFAMVDILPFFDNTFPWKQGEEGGVHPTATVHKKAQIASSAVIGPYSVVGSEAHVAEGVFIGPHCVLEEKASVGPKSFLQSHVFLGSACEVGASCVLQSHTCVGSRGYGYAKDPSGRNASIPQIGKVILEDEVELGAYTAVDRATLTRTRIGRETKLDNFCHIAHNCEIGAYGLIAAGFVIGGSSRVGDHFMCGGCVTVSDHIVITDGVQLAGRSAVRKNILKPGAYGGFFTIQPLRDFLRSYASLPHLPRLRKEWNRFYNKKTGKEIEKTKEKTEETEKRGEMIEKTRREF